MLVAGPPAEVPTRTAVGAARPRAQGQATTNTFAASWRPTITAAAGPAATAPPSFATTCALPTASKSEPIIF